ncbi:IS1634 family transposase, partial [bacterium]|nr:IS1634 family transposase [bacterium]
MRLKTTKTNTTTNYYAIIDTKTEDGKRSTKIYKRLGNEQEISKISNGELPIDWAKKQVAELKKAYEEKTLKVIAEFSQSDLIEKNIQSSFNGGYLFLQDIYYSLGLDKICKEISDKYRIKYDLNSILSNLIYTRIIEPSSKLSAFETAKHFLEQPNFELQNIYRALEIISKETENIESAVYKNSLSVVNRNTKILYYDCTNYFFEIEQAEGLKQYGKNKENRPLPIVQMGLFMDGDGLPLAFVIDSGNTNEQVTLKPLEKQIIKDFELSKFVVCTDAGLASRENRIFNNIQDRSFIVTQSLKKLKGHLKDWALDKKGWHKLNSKELINLDDIDNSSSNEDVYYKERWINENDLSQRLIVSYSPKYSAYQKNVRNSQIERAQKLINNPSSVDKNRQNDPKRFVKSSSVTADGEVADKKVLSLNQSAIDNEAMFDGFYAVCTTLEDDISDIIKVNKRRWEIEESFRILKSDFKARPVYLKRDDRIKAHFTTCFLSLLIYRILEHKLEEKYSSNQIISTLRNMNFFKIAGSGYAPTYMRTDLTDALHKTFNFRTDTEIV